MLFHLFALLVYIILVKDSSFVISRKMLYLLPIKTVCIPKGEKEELSVRSFCAQIVVLIRQIPTVPINIFLVEWCVDLLANVWFLENNSAHKQCISVCPD